MPGIVGLITTKPKHIAEPELLRMVEALRHESFYLAGTWIDERLGVYVGWVARKNSFGDGMPLTNETGDAVLVFSGEEFPDPHTKPDLRSRGHTFSQKGASYLIHRYEEDAVFPAGLNGAFHGLLADRKRGTALLFNDRYGLHRIYCHEGKDAFYFAAEAKAILAVRPECRRTNAESLGELISLGCVLDNRTLFEGIGVLPHASAWSFRNGALNRKSNYFEPREWEDQPKMALEDFHRELREVFARNLPRYFNGSEPVGMSLTGGLDTRMILAWHKPDPGSLPCYTFGGTYRECNDVIVARKVAAVCQQSHNVISVGEEFLKQFPRYAERAIYLSDGCVEVNRSPALYSNEKARLIAPVRMTGNYGDQVLRRERVFKPRATSPGLFSPDIFSYLTKARDTYQRAIDTHPLSFSAFRQAPWCHQGLFALEQTQVAMRSPYLDNDLVRTLFRAPEAVVNNNDLRVWMIGEGTPAMRRIRTDLGFCGSNGLIGSLVQRYHLFTFKAEYAYDYGMPQRLAQIDHFLAPLNLQRLFLGRHKFWHFRVWYRDALAAYVREMLFDSRTLSRPYLHGSTLEAMVQRHIKGDRNHTSEIHKVLSLELIHRLFIDGR